METLDFQLCIINHTFFSKASHLCRTGWKFVCSYVKHHKSAFWLLEIDQVRDSRVVYSVGVTNFDFALCIKLITTLWMLIRFTLKLIQAFACRPWVIVIIAKFVRWQKKKQKKINEEVLQKSCWVVPKERLEESYINLEFSLPCMEANSTVNL